MGYWLVVGSKENWDTAFENKNIWGLKKTQRHLWEKIEAKKDKVIFYVTSPVGGIIGYGLVRTKFIQDKPLWPEEVKKAEVIWPLRFEFDVESCLPPSNWKSDKLVSNTLFPRAGFQSINESFATSIITGLHKGEYILPKDERSFIKENPPKLVTGSQIVEMQPFSHGYLQDKLVQIGQLQNYIAEKEYPFDTGKLDVVWRRVINSVPTYVFEIQIGGDIYHALGKLKHAWDLWNSNIFFVASNKDYSKASGLLSGTFHEINNRIKHIELEKVNELYNKKKAYYDLEKMLGI